MLAQARAEDPVRLTDRRLAGRGAPGAVVLLSREGLDQAAVELRERLRIDWLHAPSSRCLMDSSLLQEAPPAALARLGRWRQARWWKDGWAAAHLRITVGRGIARGERGIRGGPALLNALGRGFATGDGALATPAGPSRLPSRRDRRRPS
ncbi:MAG: hypothetical protein ACREJ0_12900, partial [Geminicoccaceae bacterium]